MQDLSELKQLNEKREKRNMEQLESVMTSIANHFRKSMKSAALRNQSSLELNINLEFKDSFDSRYMQYYEKTAAYAALLEECVKNDVKIAMKLKSGSVLNVKAKW